MAGQFRSPDEYCSVEPDPRDLARLTGLMFQQAARVDFQHPGFFLLQLGFDWDSRRFRRLMIQILDGLSRQSLARRGKSLFPLSMSRFNQQTTTRPHRDGGPAESLLLLGYEPSPIASTLSLADYSQCAHDLDLTPSEFLDRHNPMFPAGEDLLRHYTTQVKEFDPAQYQILLINNSSTAFRQSDPPWQGVLHQATIPEPRDDALRVVNSIQLTLADNAEAIAVTSEEREHFQMDDALGMQYGRSG